MSVLWTAVAAGGAAAAGWVALRPGGAGSVRVPRGIRGAGAVVAVACGLAVLGRSPAPLVLALPVGVFVEWRRRQRVLAVREDAVRAAVAELCALFAADLRGGCMPHEALDAAVHEVGCELFEPVVVAAAAGADVPGALERAAGATRGAEGLRRLAACWRVSADRGAALAPAVDRVAAGLRGRRDVRDEVEAELAGVRATARLLAGLPGFGVLLGLGIGARPLDVLLRTTSGLAALSTGLVLVGAGLVWTDHLASRAVPGGG